MQEYKENIKNTVWALIKMQNEFSFKNLMKSTNLSFIELSAIIGLLLQEKKISLYVNHIHTSDKGVCITSGRSVFSIYETAFRPHHFRTKCNLLCFTTVHYPQIFIYSSKAG